MRGVNKLIVEIQNPDSEYFDKAILFLRPDKAYPSQNELSRSADALLKAVSANPPKPQRNTALIIIGIAGALLMLAGGAALLLAFA